MINQIIIVQLYQPGTAAANRIIAYAKSFKTFGKEVKLVLGCEENVPLPTLDEIEVVGVTAPAHYLLTPKMAKVVKKFYNVDSAILVYGSPFLCLFLPQNRYNIFFECTEVPLYGRTKGIVSKLKEQFKLYLAKRATGMLVISKALETYYLERGIKNITIINMFVDVERFHYQKQEKHKNYIAYCGTISPFKDGVDCLIKAFRLFHKTHSDYRLMIIGRYESEEAKRQVDVVVKEQSMADYIDFTGMVSPVQMPELLCGAQMLALARPNNEQAKYGFPTKLGEYLATGNPVIVTKVGEIGDFLSDGVNCRMAEPDNPEVFADLLSWIANHPKDAMSLGEAGKVLTQKEFSSIEQSKRVIEFMSNTSIYKESL